MDEEGENDSDEELTEDNSPGEIFEESFSGPVESEPSSTTTTTPAGEQVVEQLQESMATSSELVEKAAQAVDASAKATTELQKTVKDTTDALKTLTDAQTKTETSSPALSQQVLAQIQADPSLAKLVKDGLLKWDDLLGKNPEAGKEGHVAGVAVGDPSRGGYIVSGFRKSPSERFQKFPSERFRKFPSERFRKFPSERFRKFSIEKSKMHSTESQKIEYR